MMITQIYELAKFKYYLNDKVLKGEKVYVTTNLNQNVLLMF